MLIKLEIINDSKEGLQTTVNVNAMYGEAIAAIAELLQKCPNIEHMILQAVILKAQMESTAKDN